MTAALLSIMAALHGMKAALFASVRA